jgi:hypothetical protein
MQFLLDIFKGSFSGARALFHEARPVSALNSTKVLFSQNSTNATWTNQTIIPWIADNKLSTLNLTNQTIQLVEFDESKNAITKQTLTTEIISMSSQEATSTLKTTVESTVVGFIQNIQENSSTDSISIPITTKVIDVTSLLSAEPTSKITTKIEPSTTTTDKIQDDEVSETTDNYFDPETEENFSSSISISTTTPLVSLEKGSSQKRFLFKNY